MSWCDKLASTPTVGLKLDPHFVPADSVMQALSPIVDRFVEGDSATFSINGYDVFSTTFTTNDGFQYAINPTQISVAFKHRTRIRQTSAGPPQLVMLSQPLPFTKLLPDVTNRLIRATLLLPRASERKITRLGVVATANLALEDVPPGIKRFVEYIARPWNGHADFFNVQITADLSKSSEWSDRCIHYVIRPEEQEEKLLTVQFDWQRTLASGRAITEPNLKEFLAAAQKAATSYFEDLAEGSRFDENVIRESAGT